MKAPALFTPRIGEFFAESVEPIDSEQLWRQIPPEEKFELMAQAHSRGIAAAFSIIVVGATLAVGLQNDWLLWGSIILSPVIFQGTASKSWRSLKPRAILEYLAARSAARRFAFSLNSAKLTLTSMIRGQMEDVYEHESRSEELEADFENRRERDVWIALFQDALIVISEQAGGAKLELGQLLMKNIEMSADSPSGQGEYANDREILIKTTNNFGITKTSKLKSPYPAALIVLEKQMGNLIKQAKADYVPVVLKQNQDDDSFLNFNLDD